MKCLLQKSTWPLVVAIVFLCGVLLFSGGETRRGEEETAFQRVMRTGTIRCGYIVWAPYFTIEPNTGKKGGIAFDLMEALGKELGLKIEWREETGWGDYNEGLNANRFDMMCVPVWESGFRPKIVLLSRPVYDDGLFAFAREDDHRFDHAKMDSLNKDDVRFVVVDGDIGQNIRAKLFPKAKEIALPQLGQKSQSLLSVAGKKADIALDAAYGVAEYNKTATIKLKPILDNKPIQQFGNSFSYKIGEVDLKLAIDSTIGALLHSGALQEIVKKHPGFMLPMGY